MPKHVIEERVLDKVRSVLLQEEHLSELVRLTNEELRTAMEGIGERLQSFHSQIDDNVRRLERLYEALAG